MYRVVAQSKRFRDQHRYLELPRLLIDDHMWTNQLLLALLAKVAEIVGTLFLLRL